MKRNYIVILTYDVEADNIEEAQDWAETKAETTFASSWEIDIPHGKDKEDLTRIDVKGS